MSHLHDYNLLLVDESRFPFRENFEANILANWASVTLQWFVVFDEASERLKYY